MRYAIVSDLHSNRPAWVAVLDDIAREGVDAICCLGDIIGYGPRPRAVLASVREHCENVILGNHDAAVAGKLPTTSFNSVARAALEWTHDRLEPEPHNYLASLPLTLRGDGMLLVHGDAAKPAKFRYVTRPDQASDSFAASKRDVIFFGHTHEPGIFSCGKGGKVINRLPPEDIALTPGQRYMINPGSVGDPRCPRDLRASYCLFDSKALQVRFRRVEFDVEEYRREFEASGLQHKPFFLRVIDEESMREGAAARVVSDHHESVHAGVEEDRGARLLIGGAAVAPRTDSARALQLAAQARQSQKRSRVALVAAVLLLLVAGIALAIHLSKEEPGVASKPGGDGETIQPNGVDSARPGAEQASLRTGEDYRRIMADPGWEDPSEPGN